MKPVIKWAGGKTRVLNSLENVLPDLKKITRYIEPFFGGGAFGLNLIDRMNPDCEFIFGDANKELIVFYQQLLEHGKVFIEESKLTFEFFNSLNWAQKSIYYNEVRKRCNMNQDNKNLFQLALDFYFLNRSCHGGVYRVNKSGEFNVSIGNYKKISLCEDKLLDFIKLKGSKNIGFDSCDYIAAFDCAYSSESLVYIDPPYPVGDQSKFTSYTTKDFDHEKLSHEIKTLNSEGSKIILSGPDNKNCIIRELYKGFNITPIKVSRGHTGGNGGQYGELIITNFEPGE